MQPKVMGFFDGATHTISYVVSDPATGACAIIDSVLDYQAASGRTTTQSADQIIAAVSARDLTVEWIIDTHVHADHLSAAPYLREKLGGRVAIGAAITEVQKVFGEVFNAGADFRHDGHQFDHLFQDGEPYRVGDIAARALHTPGHTPACMSHLIGDALFVGDTLFMPDFGTARCDFPGGDAGQLYDSIRPSWPCPTARGCFSATITRRPAATPSPGKPPSGRKNTKTFMSAAAQAAPISSPCERPATRRWQCRR